MIFVVAYDLKSPNDTSLDYQRVIAAIKNNCTSWCHLEKSVFLVDVDVPVTTFRDLIKSYVHSGDSVFVSRLNGSWASYGIGDERSNWLKGRVF